MKPVTCKIYFAGQFVKQKRASIAALAKLLQGFSMDFPKSLLCIRGAKCCFILSPTLCLFEPVSSIWDTVDATTT